METVPATTASFFPTLASQWRKDSLNLTTYSGNSLNVSFVNINGYGNGLFIDNIMVEDLCELNNLCTWTGAVDSNWNIEGNWNPTILETSAHLREHGINTNGMTHQEMADIHAALHDGKPVAMKSKPTVMVNRGSSCPGGVCPTNTRTRKGLFGWRR